MGNSKLAPKPQRQMTLPMDLPMQAPTTAMRELFERRWAHWHPKTFDEAVKDAVTARLLALAVAHTRTHKTR